MSVKIRKPRPSPPKWFFYDNDNCWFCHNKHGCNSCKLLKKYKRSKQLSEKKFKYNE